MQELSQLATLVLRHETNTYFVSTIPCMCAKYSPNNYVRITVTLDIWKWELYLGKKASESCS